jgi:hypothetical protein
VPNPVVLIAFCVARLQVTRESSGDGNGVAAAPRIRIPPPRPKRKPTHPYPRKLGNSPGKDAAPLAQLDMPQLREVPSLYEQGNDSPKSVLIRAQVVRSPTSSIDAEDRCPAPTIAAVEVATQPPSYKVRIFRVDIISCKACDPFRSFRNI